MPLADRAVLQIDQAAPAHSQLLRQQRKRRKDPNLDRRRRLRAYRHRQKTLGPRSEPLHNPADGQRHGFRKNAA